MATASLNDSSFEVSVAAADAARFSPADISVYRNQKTREDSGIFLLLLFWNLVLKTCPPGPVSHFTRFMVAQ